MRGIKIPRSTPSGHLTLTPLTYVCSPPPPPRRGVDHSVPHDPAVPASPRSPMLCTWVPQWQALGPDIS